MGTEFGQRREFSEQRSLDWEQSAEVGHRGVQRLIKDMNAVYRTNPALHRLDTDPAGFSWISADDRGGNVFSFLRFDGEGQIIACVSNFAAEPRTEYRIGVPAEGVWEEILNTDAEVYDGSGQFGNLGQVVAAPVPAHGYPASAVITIPPLGSVWLRLAPVSAEETADEQQVETGTRAVAKQSSPARKRTAKKAPAKATAGAPAKATAKAPAKATAKAPAKATAKAPATDAADAPPRKRASKKTAG
jgi:1,4-alpha-glucan branching enzyme